MPIARLRLTDVRSHRALDLAPGEGFVVLTGPNGAGKTNVLEAVSLLAPGRGLRGAPLREVARSDGPGGFAVAARLGDGTELGTGTLADAPDRRQVRVNGAAASAAALGERLQMLWLTPAMDRLFVDTASARRRFLDRLVLTLDPGHAAQASRYDAAMRARNRLLAEDRSPDPAWLSALEARMAEHGAAIAAARRATVARLGDRLAESRDPSFPAASLALTDEPPAQPDVLAGALAAGRARDAAAGRTLVGPHRTDLLVTHRDKGQPAARASTGEQKALLIGILLAHAALVAAEAGRAPILLLDEVAAHLDPDRRAALFDRLRGTGSQAWMTGTEVSSFAAVGPDATWIALGG
ncbi:DNA replication and repair protein RecF [Sphingomonas jejuensis]|uniref:DNA replication and repair protein RecF n=1 Tax=Sphingomonas jejuensis TaxID=904715 RepID=A0ABX0XNQ3_9SPHN|nr:DNA replication and repair protein RecF [Sphingomonas jejuensis]